MGLPLLQDGPAAEDEEPGPQLEVALVARRIGEAGLGREGGGVLVPPRFLQGHEVVVRLLQGPGDGVEAVLPMRVEDRDAGDVEGEDLEGLGRRRRGRGAGERCEEDEGGSRHFGGLQSVRRRRSRMKKLAGTRGPRAR
jgi:hypothetical protein